MARTKKTASLSTSTKRALAELGNRVRRARQERGLHATELARQLQLSRDTIAAIEDGHPGVAMGTVLTVLHALDVDSAGIDRSGVDDDATRPPGVSPTVT